MSDGDDDALPAVGTEADRLRPLLDDGDGADPGGERVRLGGVYLVLKITRRDGD